MHLHLAAILPVCKTFNPFLKQTIAQPKDWELHFPVLASALGNLGKLLFILTVQRSRETPGSPRPTWWSWCHQNCDTLVVLQDEATACSGGGHRTFTASRVGSSLENESVSDTGLQEFPLSSHIVLRSLWGELVDFSPCRMLPKAKLCIWWGGWYQHGWELAGPIWI